MPDVVFSAIIACGHSAESLSMTLRALGDMDFHEPFEVIVADDGTQEGREDAVLSAASDGVPVRYMKLPGAERSVMWNAAISRSTGRFLAFLDDDCIPPQGWLMALQSSFSDPAVGAAGGSDRVPPDSSVFDRCLDYVLTSTAGTLGVRNGPNRLSRYCPRPWNMAVRRDALELAGGFDGGIHEAPETELIRRLEKSGFKVLYQPGAMIYHRRETSLPRFIRRDFRLGMERGRGISPQGLSRAYACALLLPAGLLVASERMHTLALGFLLTAVYAVILTLSGIHAMVRVRTPVAALSVPVMLALHHAAHITGYTFGCLSRPWYTR